jgi:ABC-type nickel/cobalt efflux system permease component RcnA
LPSTKLRFRFVQTRDDGVDFRNMQNSISLTLGLGFALGLKHAIEADHLAAVSAIVSERRSVLDAARVGALWGLGHTTSLLFAGLLVIVLGIAIPEPVAEVLELCIAVMIITLGTRLLYLMLRKSARVHVHAHSHKGRRHLHFHYHGNDDGHPPVQTHEGSHSCLSRWRTFLVGVLHGLAGSAALTLLVLTEVIRNGSPVLGLSYLLIFGIGSICGMLMMSSLIGLPFALSSSAPNRLSGVLQFSAATSSVVFGVYYGWQIVS